MSLLPIDHEQEFRESVFAPGVYAVGAVSNVVNCLGAGSEIELYVHAGQVNGTVEVSVEESLNDNTTGVEAADPYSPVEVDQAEQISEDTITVIKIRNHSRPYLRVTLTVVDDTARLSVMLLSRPRRFA